MKKIFKLLFGCCILVLFAQINGYKIVNVKDGKGPSSHATTIVEAENATFTWKLKNYRLLISKFYLNHPYQISSPLLESPDGKKVNCSLEPYSALPQDYANINDFWNSVSFGFNCAFNPQPMAYSYSYESNGIIKYIKNSMIAFLDVGNEVKIVIDAYYYDINDLKTNSD